MFVSSNENGQCFCFADVCKVPPAIPTPLPNISKCQNAEDFSEVVFINGMNAVHMASTIGISQGDESGTIGGTKSGSFIEKTEFTSGSSIVSIEGNPAVMMNSETKQNNGNGSGSVIKQSQTVVDINEGGGSSSKSKTAANKGGYGAGSTIIAKSQNAEKKKQEDNFPLEIIETNVTPIEDNVGDEFIWTVKTNKKVEGSVKIEFLDPKGSGNIVYEDNFTPDDNEKKNWTYKKIINTCGENREFKITVLDSNNKKLDLLKEKINVYIKNFLFLKKLHKLKKLTKNENIYFSKDIEVFIGFLCNTLQIQPYSDSINILINALELWEKDDGSTWGEGVWDSNVLKMTYGNYAEIPASQYKCNAYISEVIFNAVGIVHEVHPSKNGKFFPYQAAEWSNSNISISGFQIVYKPMPGDIVATGTHTGIFLYQNENRKLYISARDTNADIFGNKEQHAHGIQIKYLREKNITYRRVFR